MNINELPDKPFKSYGEQLSILEERNIIIQDKEFTEKILNTVSYYKLINGYKESLIVTDCDSEKETFKDGVTIEFLYNLHVFDITLQSILFKYILAIETSLKTKIAYLVSEQYGVFEYEYLAQKNYISSGNKRNLRKKVLTELRQDIKDTMYTPTKYYRDGDEDNNIPPKNHIPPWIIIQNISFTRALRWYSILKTSDKNKIYKQFPITAKRKDNENIERDFFLDSLKILRDYRNNVAHGYRSINVKINNYLKEISLNKIIPNFVLSPNELNNFGYKDLYSVLISIISLIDYSILEDTFIIELSSLFNSDIGKEVKNLAKLPEDFLDRLSSLKNHMKN